MVLSINRMACGYNKKPIISDVTFSISSGEAVCILGPNGIGKTTIFKTILGANQIMAGNIEIDGKNVQKLSSRNSAKLISYVPQAKGYTYQYTVLDMVVMGRTAYIQKFSSPSKVDILIAENALEQMGLLEFKDRLYSELSGGEQQLVLIARSVAQDSAFILMDEPASNLDFGNENRLLENIVNLAQNGKGILLISHSPSHAFQCCNKAYLIGKNGKKSFGAVNDILTSESLTEAYGVPIAILTDEINGKTIKTCSLY